MERFIVLLKKKLLKTITAEEEKEFDLILYHNAELRTIYNQCFSKEINFSNQDALEAEESFAVLFVKMQLKKDSKKK